MVVARRRLQPQRPKQFQIRENADAPRGAKALDFLREEAGVSSANHVNLARERCTENRYVSRVPQEVVGDGGGIDQSPSRARYSTYSSMSSEESPERWISRG